MKIIGLIQARDNSERLPRKCTTDINGKVLLQHILDRLNAVGSLDGVVVSTSTESPEIVGYCKINDIPHYVGSESDLLSRHLGAAITYRADAILRITADCVFHDPVMLEKMIGAFRDNRADALINWHRGNRSLSEGLDAELVTVKTMRELGGNKNCPREDWLTYLDKSSHFRVAGWMYPTKKGQDLHLSIDTPEDFERARKMLALMGNDNYTYADTLLAWEETR